MCMLPLAEISSRTRPFASRYSNMPMDTSVRHHVRVCIFINMCAREGGVSSEMHMHIHRHTGATGPSTSTLEHGVGQRSVFGDGRRSSSRLAHGASRNHCSRTRKHARTHASVNEHTRMCAHANAGARPARKRAARTRHRAGRHYCLSIRACSKRPRTARADFCHASRHE